MSITVTTDAKFYLSNSKNLHSCWIEYQWVYVGNANWINFFETISIQNQCSFHYTILKESLITVKPLIVSTRGYYCFLRPQGAGIIQVRALNNQGWVQLYRFKILHQKVVKNTDFYWPFWTICGHYLRAVTILH